MKQRQKRSKPAWIHRFRVLRTPSTLNECTCSLHGRVVPPNYQVSMKVKHFCTGVFPTSNQVFGLFCCSITNADAGLYVAPSLSNQHHRALGMSQECQAHLLREPMSQRGATTYNHMFKPCGLGYHNMLAVSIICWFAT